jgi:hypothetical protein
MIVSAGQLHSSARLIDIVAACPIAPSGLEKAGGLVLVCPISDVLNLSTRCGWLLVNDDGKLYPSSRGEEIRRLADYQERLRQQLRDIIAALHPAWSKVLMHGRHEMARFAPPDICQCFREAGVMVTDPTDGIVTWWDELANLARGIRSAASLAVGRAGERLTLRFEHQRTARKPTWQSIESSYSGFDVLSSVSDTDHTPMQIEVKASELRLKEAFLYLTCHEWETALQAQAHAFHLWHIGQQSQLAVVKIDEMSSHVPSNQGKGAWQSVRIPYSAFLEFFNRPRFLQA